MGKYADNKNTSLKESGRVKNNMSLVIDKF